MLSLPLPLFLNELFAVLLRNSVVPCVPLLMLLLTEGFSVLLYFSK